MDSTFTAVVPSPGIRVTVAESLIRDLGRVSEWFQPTTFDHIDMKHTCGPHGKPCGDPMLITFRDLQKAYTLNKYHFSIFIHYNETMKVLVTHIN